MSKKKLVDLFTRCFQNEKELSESRQKELRLMVDYIEDIARQSVKEALASGVTLKMSGKEDCTTTSVTFNGIMAKVYEMTGVEDDAGCDWFTDESGNTYIGGIEWHVSSDKNVAKLVEAANIIAYSKDYVVGSESSVG